VTDATDHLTNGTWAGDWILDPDRSAVHFRSTSMWGLVGVTGQFSTLRGHGSLGRDGTGTGTLSIDASSVDTGNKRRDKHLRSDHFFHAAAHPEITFSVSGIHPDGPGRVRVTGELRILDEVGPLELTATLDDADPTGATLTTVAELDRSKWGIDFNKLGAIAMTTRIEGRLRFTRPSPVADSIVEEPGRTTAGET
jgi:polyisoprenoid-binding protein YceI